MAMYLLRAAWPSGNIALFHYIMSMEAGVQSLSMHLIFIIIITAAILT